MKKAAALLLLAGCAPAWRAWDDARFEKGKGWSTLVTEDHYWVRFNTGELEVLTWRSSRRSPAGGTSPSSP